ncbi:hypothetical protein PC9H_007250 [Pleurotus ostreatus]|uniref:Brain protein I3 n=1 Tax=Pleurotus ostreatus TaxID=5322 RepID=A0A8H6ZT85_PLEOS|nr:uncharacterized protein PC9H_007250 [Pleurotus ostreatus]KAF7428031.1 hypothetical protein PC9H_007250 [Pleurotus ostreatus]
MIIIPQNDMASNNLNAPTANPPLATFLDSPPPYDPQDGRTTVDNNKKADQLGSPHSHSQPQPQPQPQLQPQPSQPMLADLSIPVSYGAVMLPGPPPVHQYRGPNGEILYGLLPPTHPEMICLQQGHDEKTHYGILGLLAAVFWFPLGIGLCMLDSKVKCKRCHKVIDEGICG